MKNTSHTSPTSIHAHPLRRPAVILIASALLLCTLPATAALSGAMGAGGAGHSLKETLTEATDTFGEMVTAFIDGDTDTAKELAGEVAKTPGKLIQRAFPVLDAPQAIADRLKAAKHKVERLADSLKTGLTDARAALATDRNDKNGGWSDAALLKGEPLQPTTATPFAAASLKPQTASTATLSGTTGQGATANSWDFNQWVAAKQQANPHCYGVVDPDTLPPECFGGASAESPAANRTDNTTQAKTTDWHTDDWTADTGWAGWDQTDTRYTDADREAARVGVFAARCWGVYEVTKSHGLYNLMQDRMQRNDCPNEETKQAASDNTNSDYTDALADVLEANTATPADADYLSALNDLEAKEAERLRLEEEERRRQARLEEERQAEQRRLTAERREEARARQAQRERRREYDRAEQHQQAEYRRQALQNLNESLKAYSEQVNRAYGLGGTTGGNGPASATSEGPGSGHFDYCRKTPGVQRDGSLCQVPCHPGSRSRC